LADVYEKLIAGEGRISLCAGFINTSYPFVDQTYYMGGFEVYTPTKEDVVANHATYLAGAYEAGVTNAQKSVYDGETVIAYNVVVGEKITEVSGPNKNVFANMFVGQNGIPADVLEAYGIASTAWQNGIRISFDVYSTDAIDFKMHTSNSTSVPMMGGSNTGTKVATTTAGAWTNVTIDFTDVTSATFEGWARIVTVKSCSSYEVGSTAYTYYVKNFSIEERTVETLLPTYATYRQGAQEAGSVSATTTTLNNEKVVKYDVAISEKITNQTSTNINSNMFVANEKMPSDILEVCGVTTTTGWTTMTITFQVYSDVVIGFETFYASGTTRFNGFMGGSATPQASSTAGQWTTITLTTTSVTSATFADYAFRIGARSILAGNYSDYKTVGTHAYTYYVKDFTITVS
jgi:hypothetical protein